MLRFTATACFTLTLFCPAFCLARTDDGCTASAQTAGDNCEAMTFGAVVEKSDARVPSPAELLPSLDGLLPTGDAGQSPDGLSLLARRSRRRADPPPSASRRRAFLQVFLI